MGRSAAVAGNFVDLLESLSDGSSLSGQLPLDPATLAGKSQREIADAIVEATVPADGSQDAEVSRDSAARAFSEILEDQPNADLTALTSEQIELFFERFLANDLVARIQLDVGNAIIDRAPDAATAVARMEQMQAYVRQEFSRAVRELREAGARLVQGSGRALANAAIGATLTIFESWLE